MLGHNVNYKSFSRPLEFSWVIGWEILQPNLHTKLMSLV